MSPRGRPALIEGQPSVYMGVRVSTDDFDYVIRFAQAEHEGNVSAAVRAIIQCHQNAQEEVGS